MKIIIKILLFTIVLSCTQPVNTVGNLEKVELSNSQKKTRDSLIKLLHKYDGDQIEQSKSLLFSETLGGDDPCYWMKIAIQNFYIKEFKDYLKNNRCSNLPSYLNIACTEYNIDIVDYLLKKGADPNASSDGFYPLNIIMMNRNNHYQSYNPAMDSTFVKLKEVLNDDRYKLIIVKNLLRHGARVDNRDGFGMTALDYARKLENPVFLNLLLETSEEK